MSHQHAIHHLKHVSGPLSLASAEPAHGHVLSATDHALSLMTDFTVVPAFTVGHLMQIDQVLAHMKIAGVRFLFVKNLEEALVGYITAYDILGEKPMKYLQSIDCNRDTCTRTDVLVENIMTPIGEWDVLDYSYVVKATVAQLTQIFNDTGKRHLVVVQNHHVRGIISATRMEQATGVQLGTIGSARSFMEIGRALI